MCKVFLLAFKKAFQLARKRHISNHNAIYMVTIDYMKGMCKDSAAQEDRQVTSLSRCHSVSVKMWLGSLVREMRNSRRYRESTVLKLEM